MKKGEYKLHYSKNIQIEKDNINQELSEISKSIEAMREKLNKMIDKGLKLDKETIETSQQLDKLIQDYYFKRIKIKDNN